MNLNLRGKYDEQKRSPGCLLCPCWHAAILAVVCFSLLLLGLGCSLTPYRPLGVHGGYSDQEIEQGKFRIFVQGQFGTDYSLIKGYFERRAKEICQRYGSSAYKLVSLDEKPCELCLIVKPEVIGTIQCEGSPLTASSSNAIERREVNVQLDSQFQNLAMQLSAGFKGQRVPLVAVLPVGDASNAGNRPLGNYLTERITNKLYATGLVKVVERAQLGKVMEELALAQGGGFDEGSAKKIGRFLGVDAVVTGTYAELGNQTVEVNSRVVSVETGEVLGIGTVQIPRASVQQMLR